MALTLQGYVTIPPGTPTAFDHGDVDLASGHVFIAHTAADAVEVIDPAGGVHIATIPGCPEASGVLCVQDERLVFAAARGAGKIVMIDAVSMTTVAEIAAGAQPNGLAWDDRRRQLLVADVADATARIVDPDRRSVVATVSLPGRPRWCVYDRDRDRLLVNIREPASVLALDPQTLDATASIPISSAGPHGLDIDQATHRAFSACDGGRLVAIDLTTHQEVGSAPIPGAPDATWFNPARGLLYVAVGNPGVLSVIDVGTMTVAEERETEPGAGTTAFDLDRQQLYSFLPRSSRVAIYAES